MAQADAEIPRRHHCMIMHNRYNHTAECGMTYYYVPLVNFGLRVVKVQVVAIHNIIQLEQTIQVVRNNTSCHTLQYDST